MEKNIFADLILKFQIMDKKFNELFDIIGCEFPESGPFDIAYTIFDKFINYILDDEGIDIVYWWLYDSLDDKIYVDDEGNDYQLTTIEDLYNYLASNDHFV